MTRLRSFLAGVGMVAILLLNVPATAQAPPPEVRYVRIDEDDYYCTIIVDYDPTEAPPLPERTPTSEYAPMSTPPVSVTPAPPDSTAPPLEQAPAAPTVDSTQVKNTVTPIPIPTLSTLPASGCTGRITPTQGLNARQRPVLGSTVLGVFGYGMNIDVLALDVTGYWYKTTYANQWAWVFAAHVTIDNAVACLWLPYEGG